MDRFRKACAGLLLAVILMSHAVAIAAPTSKLKNNLRVTGNLQVDGTSTVTGATTQTGNFSVGGNLAVTGTSAFTGVSTFTAAPVLTSGTFTANGDTHTIQDFGNSNILQNVGAQTISGVKTYAAGGTPIITAGGGAETFMPSGKIYHLITSVATAADTTETDGATKSVGANTLSTDGANLRFKIWGTTANTANNKTVKLYWNGVAVFTSGTTSQNKDWVFYMDVIRTGSNTQKIVVNGVYNDAVVVPVTTTGSATDSGAIVIKNTMTNGTAAASDIVTEGAILEVIR